MLLMFSAILPLGGRAGQKEGGVTGRESAPLSALKLILHLVNELLTFLTHFNLQYPNYTFLEAYNKLHT